MSSFAQRSADHEPKMRSVLETREIFKKKAKMTPRGTATRNVNVTLQIMKNYSTSKERKELLAVGILFHIWRPNGVVWNVNYRNLMGWLHVGKAKAKRLLLQMQGDKLFHVCGDKVCVGSFRDKTQKVTRKGRRYSGAVCARFDANRDYTLKELYSIINDLLVVAEIKGTFGLTTFSIEDSVHPRSFLTCRKLAKDIGMSRSSVSRLTTRLKDKHIIIKDPSRIFTVIGREHAKEIDCILHRLNYKTVTFTKGADSWIIIPCGYAVTDRYAFHSIRHKIYGYKSKKSKDNPDAYCPWED